MDMTFDEINVPSHRAQEVSALAVRTKIGVLVVLLVVSSSELDVFTPVEDRLLLVCSG